jgi:two-component system cell cycle sensor histidine kinase/response regulator CckA
VSQLEAYVQRHIRRAVSFHAQLLEVLGQAVIATDADGMIVFWNYEAEALFGWSAPEVMGRRAIVLVTDDAAQPALALMIAALLNRQRWSGEIRFGRRDGTVFPGLIKVTPIADDDGTVLGFAGVIRDTSAEKQLAAALHEHEQLYRLLAEQTSDLIAVIDVQGSWRYVSPTYETTLGYKPVDLIGQVAYNLVHPDDIPSVREQWTMDVLRRTVQSIFRLRHIDGSWRWFESSSTMISWRGQLAIMSIARDMNTHALLEEQLLQIQALHRLGRLTSGVAHDCSNLLTGIYGTAEIGMQLLPADSEVRDDLEDIRRAAALAATLTRQLLTVARKQVSPPQVVDLNDRIRDLGRLLSRLVGSAIEIVPRLTPNRALVKVEPGQIEQVLINLVSNARDAMPRGGTLSIETASTYLDNDTANSPRPIHTGAYVILTVSDTGIGMDAAVQERIFEPFYTTKGTDKGTGLGLCTVYDIIKQHGGVIRVVSQPGEGTSFSIYLPQVCKEDSAR